jgi:hypothetical protein
MTVNVQINPDVEAKLSARARSNGESLESYIQRVLEEDAAASEELKTGLIATGQKPKTFRAWADSFPKDLPTLTLEDVSRERLMSGTEDARPGRFQCPGF